MLQPTEIDRLLVVMAHPDDVDFGSAGTMATLTALGVHVTYCLVTDGDAGGSDRSITRTEMASMRRKEQTAAAAVVGVHDLVFLGHPDGRVVADLALRRDISRVIRQVRPQVVLCQSPDRNLDRIFASHPDHLAAGEAALCAVYPDSRNPFRVSGTAGGRPRAVVRRRGVAVGPPCHHRCRRRHRAHRAQVRGVAVPCQPTCRPCRHAGASAGVDGGDGDGQRVARRSLRRGLPGGAGGLIRSARSAQRVPLGLQQATRR